MMADTIAAIATAVGNAGISVIRVSGNAAFAIVGKVFINHDKKKIDLSAVPTHTARYGYIVDQGTILDEVLILIMKGPKSYTGEDTVEIDCHGGAFVTEKILETVIKAGAFPAEPGEFTKRAFLNGRVDLSSAEAVMGVIESRNEYALLSSMKQLRGGMKEVIAKIRSEILYHTAYIESALDDPEHISLDGYSGKLESAALNIREELDQLLRTADNGRIRREGLKVVIIGRPNVGKSSLLNTLLGEDRAIVTDIPGTTRDTLEEQINLGGILINILDTAGIRETDNKVEQIGVRLARSHVEDSDLVFYVMDASEKPDCNDIEIIKFLKNHKTIVLLNKTDLPSILTVEETRKFLSKYYNIETEPMWPIIEVSAKQKQGINEIENYIRDMFFEGTLSYNDELVITNVRYKKAISDAYDSMGHVLESIRGGLPEDFYSIDLMDAYETLGKITGETAGEDLINEIFSKFCTGK